jgi:asparagine synthase (glutamine-hydrolysing)
MCGIAGIFHSDPSQNVDSGLLRRMTSVLSHRGPDGEGVYLDGAIGLGHRRLSIIDVEGGRQPMLSEDRTSAIVFNGEIYNYRSLRDALLKKGHKFESRSDTEVILHAYEEYGPACVTLLRGMFAFAIWDAKAQRLFLARDRIGIKPLYYYWNGEKLLFGSEIKPILEDPTVSRAIDPLALDDYLTYLYVPAPKTIFQGIRKLRPGHTLTVSPRRLREEEYWDVVFEPTQGGHESAVARELLDKLHETTQIHLMSEVPLGAFLSGGLDSSAVVGIMSQLLERPVNTASIGFRESAFDELPYARQVATHFRTNAYEKVITTDAVGILDELAWHFDEPFADSSMIPTYYVSQVARERVTVCLSGDGGDENFAGYRRYRFDVLENRVRSLIPAPLRRVVFGTLATLYPKADWLPRVLRAKTVLENLALSPEAAYFHTMTWLTPPMKKLLYRDGLRKALSDYDPFSVMAEHFARTRDCHPLSRIQYVDIKTYLVDDILAKVDRASMAHSLEVRVPLLDHEMVEYAARIPAPYKLHGRDGKYIFKRALQGLVPPEVLSRPKMGFSIPLAEWFRGDLKPVFEEKVFSPDPFIGSVLNIGQIRHWWNQHQRRTRDYSYQLWSLLMLEVWGRRFARA